MLKYLVIQLDDTSTSYCHYEVNYIKPYLISLNNLKMGIRFAMLENLSIQFVYPSYILPNEYYELINTIDHSDVVPATCLDDDLKEDADIVVFNDWNELNDYPFIDGITGVLRTTKKNLFDNYACLKDILDKVTRLNVVITDIEDFNNEDFILYKNVLSKVSEWLLELSKTNKNPQLNLLTDRLVLNKMNNCNAGVESITLAPDGKFYVCPAFYCANDNEDFGLGKSKVDIGNLSEGLNIKNPQLYTLSHAPICRKCDAYQCKRCVWLNRKTTYEVNVPGHEQCVVAHLERNASRELLAKWRIISKVNIKKEIKEIDYLDPFDKISRI